MTMGADPTPPVRDIDSELMRALRAWLDALRANREAWAQFQAGQ